MGYVELCVFRRLSLSLLSGADLNAIAADTGSFLTAYIVIPWFFIMLYGWKWYKKTRFVRLDDIDFDSGKRQRKLPLLAVGTCVRRATTDAVSCFRS